MQIFGEFIEEFPPEKDSLELTFTPTSVPLKNVGEIIVYQLISLPIILQLFYPWMMPNTNIKKE